MAFGPSISFYAPNWDPGLVKVAESKATPVQVDAFHAWLKSLGFEQHPGPGNNFTFHPIDVYVHRAEQEVVFVTVDFGMTDDEAPERMVSGWEKLAEQLCDMWGFSLADTKAERIVPLSEFRRLVAQDYCWRVIATSKGWPTIWTGATEETGGVGKPEISGAIDFSYDQRPAS